ncbi:MAG TPA: heme ABC transporter permease, partial [Burkholderiales bacterium]|nr:heme ABC transporter permease [Burkholderiales bacterium]
MTPVASMQPAPAGAARARWLWFASPATFYPLAGKLQPVFAVLALLLCAAGLYVGFFAAPTDATQ